LASATLGDGEGGAILARVNFFEGTTGGAERATRQVAETIRSRLEAAAGGKVVKVERYDVGLFDVTSEET
jgi:hypothetical protein